MSNHFPPAAVRCACRYIKAQLMHESSTLCQGPREDNNTTAYRTKHQPSPLPVLLPLLPGNYYVYHLRRPLNLNAGYTFLRRQNLSVQPASSCPAPPCPPSIPSAQAKFRINQLQLPYRPQTRGQSTGIPPPPLAVHTISRHRNLAQPSTIL